GSCATSSTERSEAEAARPLVAVGRLDDHAGGGARPLLRLLHAGVVQPPLARLARGVPRPPPPGCITSADVAVRPRGAGARPALRLGPPAEAGRDARPDRAAEHPPEEEPLRHRP